MPGSGKSTVGRHLAKRIGRSFLDTDAVIEQRLGCSIRSFFDREGEDAFRDVEAGVIAEVVQQTSLVIATGGGAVLRADNRDRLHQLCRVVYLKTTPENLYRRIRTDVARPLLQVPDPQAALRRLFTERDPLYSEAAHFIVETGRPSVTTLVNMVSMQLELSGDLTPSN
jgi:shikimate kinase